MYFHRSCTWSSVSTAYPADTLPNSQALEGRLTLLDLLGFSMTVLIAKVTVDGAEVVLEWYWFVICAIATLLAVVAGGKLRPPLAYMAACGFVVAYLATVLLPLAGISPQHIAYAQAAIAGVPLGLMVGQKYEKWLEAHSIFGLVGLCVVAITIGIALVATSLAITKLVYG